MPGNVQESATQAIAAGPVATAERDLLDRLGAVVFQTDAAGNWTYLNRAWTTITGFSIEETLGTNFLDYVHPDEREHTVALFMAVMEGAAEACHHETRYRTASGDFRWLELRATLLFDDARQLVGNCGTLTDITGRRETAQAIDERVQLTELVASGEAFDDLPYGALLLDNDLVVQRASATARRLLGHSLEIGTAFSELLPLFDTWEPSRSALAPEWGPLRTAARTGQTQYAELSCRPADGSGAVWLQTTVIPSPDPHDSSGQLVVLLQDVTELRRAEARQAAVAALGQRALEAVTLTELLDGAVESVVRVLEADFADLFVTGADGEVQLRSRFGWPGSDDDGGGGLDGLLHLAELALLVERPVHTNEIALPQSYGFATASSLSVPVHSGALQLVVQAHSINERTFRPEEAGFLQVLGGVLASAIARRESEEAAVAQSLHDPLTGLANRMLLHTRLELALRNGQETHRGLAVLALDLDQFKRVNDTLGHAAGDEVLRGVAARMIRATRDADTVARVGGDEFIIVLPGLFSQADASHVAAKVHASVAQPLYVGESRVEVQASIGVAVVTESVAEPAWLLKRADNAMYQAKHSGRNFVVLADDSSDDTTALAMRSPSSVDS